MSHEPSESEISEFLEARPGGGTLEEVASVWGVTRERIRQVEAKALKKLAVQLRWRRIYKSSDAIPDSLQSSYSSPSSS